ncbi:MAG TPA: PKD domain-containing protein, partial [Chitinophagales bacterium]|nr:PKD domain-containing protein [Chitinophagales bacterium]
MKTTKTLLLLMLLYAAGMVNAQCVWYYPTYQGGGTYSFTVYGDSAGISPSYAWTFDDGGTATGPNVQHTFTTSGMHGWCLNYSGSCNVTLCDSQYVNVCDWPVSVTRTEGDTVVSFGVLGAQPGWTYSWDFPDGVPSTSTSATPTISFPGPGNHWGNLEITTPNGCIFHANASVNITVENTTGNCNPWAYASTGNFGQVSFIVFTDSGATVPAYQWDFGDGTGSNQQNPQHTYTTSGTYTYCVDYNGPNCSGNICRTIEVDVCSAGTYITYTTVDSTATLTLNGAPAGSTYAWSFPDGNITTSTTASPVVVFPGVGNYNVSVTITTPGGCTLTSTQTVSIVGGGCQGWAYVQAINGDHVTFYAAGDSVGGLPASFNWAFGDGTTATGQYVSHTYPANGNYQYCVTLNGNMCTNTICDTVAIDVCQFTTHIYTTATINTSATFALTGATAGWSYQWSFPGGTPSTSTAANPTVTFPAYGTYTANVTVTTSAGCVKHDSIGVTITDPCQVHVSANQTFGGDFHFHAYTDTVGWLGTYTWDFGDGTTGTGAYPFHAYQTSGTY